MYAIKSKRQQLIIGMLSLLFYAVTASVANENVLQQLEKEFQKVVTDTRSAVVKVVATQRIPPNAEKPVFTRQEIGSGIVINTTGHVVTTTFEMEIPSKIEVTFNNGAVSPAELIGTDIFTDIAVLRVAKGPLTVLQTTTHSPKSKKTAAPAPSPALSQRKAFRQSEFKTTGPVKWGDSSKIDTGSWVVTIGSSYGQSPIVSFGIVGGWDTLPNQLCRELIKINAAVTPGNSGGAVINTSGEIIGMILAVLTEPPNTSNSLVDTLFQNEVPPDIAQFFQEQPQESRTQEITFAMPIETVHAVAEEIIEHGKVARGWLGIEVDVSEFGVFVTGVVAGSPAQQSGLLPRDLILEFNEVPVRSYDELLRCVVSERPTTKIQLKIGRNGTEQHRTVILGEKE
ncbi:PDZ domain-containing protein [Candidatus Poribacteria bacterium]|nr:PDZ domain-containing protein [Candidatus Poribacteria bacterium]MYH80600.1 PDZ domain-containing protein [Candidatus Poribacteria bacterium]